MLLKKSIVWVDIGLLILALMLFGIAGCTKDHLTTMAKTKETDMKYESTYPTFHASPRRDCAIPVTSGAKGDIAWSHELGLPNTDVLPALLIWDEHIVAVTFPELALFTTYGKRLWQRTKQIGSSLAVANGLLYYENKWSFLDAVNIENELVLDSDPLPGAMNDEFRVTLLWPGKRDFIAVAFWPGLESEQDPEVLVRRVVYGEDISLWGENFKGSQQSLPIFVPESDALVLSMIGEVIYIDTKLGDVTARYIISLDELVYWSADQEGTLCITGYHEEQKELLALI